MAGPSRVEQSTAGHVKNGRGLPPHEPWNLKSATSDLSDIISEEVLQAIVDGKSSGLTEGHRVAAGRLLARLRKAQNPVENLFE